MAEQTHLQPSEVHEVLARHVLTDGMKLVLDLRRSRGSRLVDARTGRALPRHVHLLRLGAAGAESARHRRRPDVHGRACRDRCQQAGQSGHVQHRVRRVRRDVRPGARRSRHSPTCSSSKAARWPSKTRSRSPSTGRAGQNEAAGRDRNLGTQIMHLTNAFHGRSGYTLSLTNTEPNKTDRFPKFDWPRIDVPAITHPAQ